MHPVAQCAVEAFAADGARTRERLESLVEDYAESQGYDEPGVIANLKDEACEHAETNAIMPMSQWRCVGGRK